MSQIREKLLVIESVIETQIKQKQTLTEMIDNLKSVMFNEEDEKIAKRILKKWEQYLKS